MQNNTFSTLFIGQKLIKLIEVDSTNTYLKRLLSNSEPLAEGTVIMAAHQTAGRGQQGANWESEQGKNIILSVYLAPRAVPLDKQFFLNMAIALAVTHALQQFIKEDIKVKWPNDIYWQNKKLGGILIENTLAGTCIKSSIIGIGINVNQRSFSHSISSKTISAANILGEDLNIDAVVEQLCIFLEKYYLLLLAKKYDILHKYYSESLYLRGELSLFEENGKVFEGKITNVDESGFLLMDAKSLHRKFNFKEVQFLHTHTR
ncbi:BirA family biotin operon repressor/biotin-[acetyl-CoA-carboxylase] ligase [Pedobacter sp. UYP30]|uniref:biotin--[acetyl-CoA-carboxylase] ligase n=1 Tax=Pedobacter sp. UYP30 TaxID=1756400 RepID=UPI0033973B1C